jgi:hypothetical protein
MKSLQILAGVLLLSWTLSPATAVQQGERAVEQYGIFELALDGPSSGNPFVDVELSAEFRSGTRVFQADGFYDGSGVYRVRFMPDAAGEWRYLTKSSAKELDGRTGSFVCTRPEPGNHGPVSVRNVYHFGYADGGPFYPVGTTCYAWVWQGQDLVKQTLATLKNSPFNKIRMCFFPKQYGTYIQNEPPMYPYEGSKQVGWNFARFNPEYFRYFEQRVADLMKLGIEADIILFHPYDRGKWGFDGMKPEENDRYLRYIVARMAAYRNVWWSLANEFDLISSKSRADWDRFFQIIHDKDPYHHLCSIHNGMSWYDQSKPWVTHLSVQTPYFEKIQDWRETYRKPVVIDECVYEGNIPTDWGNLPAEELVHRFWVAYCRGAYATHGETYLHPDNILWWAKGGKLYGKSPERIGFLHKIMTEAPSDDLTPLHNLWNKETYLYREGTYYLYYYGISQQLQARFMLPKDRKFKIEVIDAWNMTVTPIPGEFSGQTEIPLPGRSYMAVRASRTDAGGAAR